MVRRTRSRMAASGVLIVGSLLLAACADTGSGDEDDDPQAGVTTVTFRLWDETASAAYEESFDAFTATHRDIHIDIEVVPWDSYWDRLASDAASGTLPDVFWTNTANYGRYVDDGRLVSITEALGDAHEEWQPAVVDLYTRDDQLWGVPQLWDSVALYYNADLVEAADVDPANLTWVPDVPAPEDAAAPQDDAEDATADDGATTPDGATPDDDATTPTDPAEPEATEPADPEATEPGIPEATEPADAAPLRDTFLPAAQALTVDAAGRTAAEDGFDPQEAVQYGFNAELNPQGIYLPFLAQAGAEFQSGEEFAFDSPEGVAAFQYLVDLVTVHHVAPPANQTIGSDAALQMFLDGRIALFQSGPYHLRHIADEADFSWGVVPPVAGPEGSVSLVHGVVAAANANGDNLDATTVVLDWIGSTDGQLALASQGIALPGVVAAQDSFLDYWQREGVDVSAFLDAAAGPLTPPPTGPDVQAGLEAIHPVLAEMFQDEVPVPLAVSLAEDAGNEALTEP